MKHLITLITVLALVSASAAQNQVDDLGRKTGPWRVEYPNGNTRYEGEFREGKPVGTMLRYHENGKMQARIVFSETTKRSDVSLYFESGNLAAEGIYLDQKKDSVWTYFSDADGSVRIRESYEDGLLHGYSRSYYPEGNVSEETVWAEGKKQGSWMQFFENGSHRLRANYENDLMEGTYKVWYPGEVLMMEGLMQKGRSQGAWNYYDEEGSLIYTIEYEDGIPSDRELYQKMMEETLMQADTTMSPQGGQPF